MLDRLAHRVDPTAVVRLEETRAHAERLGDVAVGAGPRHEVAQRGLDGGDIRGRAVERDVALCEHLGIARGVDRGDMRAPPLELLGNASGPGEQVEGPARAGNGRDRTQHRYQPSFRTDVLDHDEERA